MLKAVNEKINTEGMEVRISEAMFPAPFKSTLEFNPPAHGVWNIVHTGMLIPQSHQIYICSPNCMRGVVLTAAEMNALERFSQVVIHEKDVLAGSIEELTIEGVTDCLKKLQKLPRAVLVFTVCVHHFLGSDLDWIYKELSRRFPDVTFIRCFMDPVMRKNGLTPDQKMRRSLYEPLEALPANPKTVALLGSDFISDEEGDLKTYLRENSITLKELPACKTYDEYLKMADADLFICTYPPALEGARDLAARLGRPLLYLPLTFGFEEIQRNEERLAAALGCRPRDLAQKQAEAKQALEELKGLAKDTKIAIDYTIHPRPLGLARLLLEAGFNVTRVYLDVISSEEEDDFYFLKKNYPKLLLCATTHPKCRILHGQEGNVLAIGQKAAWFTGSRHFVNIVEGAGLYGFNGIVKLAGEMKEALKCEKEPEDFITRKGLGCESCIL